MITSVPLGGFLDKKEGVFGKTLEKKSVAD